MLNIHISENPSNIGLLTKNHTVKELRNGGKKKH